MACTIILKISKFTSSAKDSTFFVSILQFRKATPSQLGVVAIYEYVVSVDSGVGISAGSTSCNGIRNFDTVSL